MIKSKKNILYTLIVLSVLFSSLAPVFAKIEPANPSLNPFVPQDVVNQSPIQSYRDVNNIIKSIVAFIYNTFFVIAILFILLAAYNYLLGGQDEKKIAIAKSQLKYAVIAIAVALIAGGVALILDQFIRTAT